MPHDVGNKRAQGILCETTTYATLWKGDGVTMIQTRKAPHTHTMVLAAALVLLGCGERQAHEASGTVAFRLASRPEAAAPVTARSAGDSTILSLGRDTIIIRRAELVLKDILLAPVESGECDPEEEEEACSPIATGPVLVQLPLNQRTGAPVTATVPAKKYIVFHFAFYVPDADRDREFLTAHPTPAGASVHVEGTYSRSGMRTPFVYTAAFGEEHETGLLPVVSVAADSTTNLTLRLNLSTWFLNAEKTAFIDPATAGAGGPNQQLVHDNIRTSVAAFRDDDFDGLDDQETTIGMKSYSSPWPAAQASTQLEGTEEHSVRSGTRPCRDGLPHLTGDSIGPLRLEESLADLRRECPSLWFAWDTDPDGFAVPAVVARLGPALVTALLTDTLPTATVRQVTVTDARPRTKEGFGVGSTLGELQHAYGTPGASEPGCVLSVWFPNRPGLAFRMAFPTAARRECGGLSEPPLPPELRVAAVLLVPT